MYILSAFADEYDISFDKQLSGLQSNSINYIEIRNLDKMNIADVSDCQLNEIADKLNHAKICVSAIGSPLGKVLADCNAETYQRKTERICQIADVLSCRNIRVFSFYKPQHMSNSDYKDAVLRRLEIMLKVASRYNKRICLENEADLYGESPEHCFELLDHFKGELRFVFDMGNFRLQGHEPYPFAYELLRDYIEYFHIKDAFAHGSIVPAGCGDAKIKEILQSYCQEFERDCFVCIEPHLVTFDGLEQLCNTDLQHEYVYQSNEEAFSDAVRRFKKLIEM